MAESRIMGYARVSSAEQNLARQLMELKKYVPEENIITDKQSGKPPRISGAERSPGIEKRRCAGHQIPGPLKPE